VFATAGGPPMVRRMDNGPELIYQALQAFCAGKVGLSDIPPGAPWDNGYINRSTTGSEGSASTAITGPTCSKPVWSSATSSTNTIIGIVTRRCATSPRPSMLPDAATPNTRGLRDQLKSASITTWLQNRVDRLSGTCQRRLGGTP
jgi:hypothetical protein